MTKKPLLKEGFLWDEETQTALPYLRKRELDRERRAIRFLIERGYSVRKTPSLQVIDGGKRPDDEGAP
jgi:hypothetical protein